MVRIFVTLIALNVLGEGVTWTGNGVSKCLKSTEDLPTLTLKTNNMFNKCLTSWCNYEDQFIFAHMTNLCTLLEPSSWTSPLLASSYNSGGFRLRRQQRISWRWGAACGLLIMFIASKKKGAILETRWDGRNFKCPVFLKTPHRYPRIRSTRLT